LTIAAILSAGTMADLDEFLIDLRNPASASYRHFLTPQEFTARFCPIQENYDAVIAFAKAIQETQ
jgi:subtilase family serine protease